MTTHPAFNKHNIIISVVMFSIFLAAMFIIKVKFSHPPTQAQMEASFTPEQKAVITAWKNCADEMNQARTQLEQAKRELNDLIVAARAVAISKGVDPNTQVTWLPMNGQPVMCGDKQALWGFRADGTITWKCP